MSDVSEMRGALLSQLEAMTESAIDESVRSGDRWWEGRTAALQDVRALLSASEVRRERELERMAEAALECAADLEGELYARYHDENGCVHPAERRRYERDMAVVWRVRQLAHTTPSGRGAERLRERVVAVLSEYRTALLTAQREGEPEPELWDYAARAVWGLE